MKKYSKYYSIDTYKPGGITEKLSLYHWMLNDRTTNLAEARKSLDPNNPNPETEEQIEKLRKNLEGWSNQYYEFKNKPNNDPDIIKTIFDSLVQLSKIENPTALYKYMTELNNITITDPDINYLLDIFKAQRETFERTYFDDVADNIDQANSRAEAETELPANIFSEELTRKISNNYHKIVKLAAYYDNTQQYKKADKIEKSLKEINMNKKQILASLNKIANELDNSGLYKEATSITAVMKKIAQEDIPTDLNQDFSRKQESYGNQGRNIVREIMEIIADKLRDNEAARKRFSGGQLQSFVFSILDILVSEGMNKAFSELNKDLREYGVIIGEDELYMLFRDYSRSNRNKD
jgi:hypothetical protein